MNSKKRCASCKRYFPAESMIKTLVGNFHKEECRKEWAFNNTKKLIEKAKQAESKKNKSEKREFYAKDKEWQHKQTQKSFNKMRKLQEIVWYKSQGKEPQCISCGKTKMDWCCGHFKTVGSQGSLRYDVTNTELQCNRYCNKALSGNINGNKTTRGYIQGLKDKYGESEAKRRIDYLNVDRIKKWTCEELEEMRKGFNVEIRNLSKTLDGNALL